MEDGAATYLEATEESGRRVFGRGLRGPVVMLNLLRFRDQADYTDAPELAPVEPISGRRAYKMYMEHTLPHLNRRGGSLRFVGEGGNYLIGPGDEQWDLVMMVDHQSLEALMDMASDPDYLAGLGHRTAALIDSRLLPIVPSQPTQLEP